MVLLMSKSSINIEYNTDLDALVKLLSHVKRPGDYYVTGSLIAPMPKLEITGVGIVSFPVPESQVKEIIRQAQPAPYGRGEQTILDPSVRKVWQIATNQLQLSGKAWTDSINSIVENVLIGLGCRGANVIAELYKLLIYDPGSFFLSHRDTEKAEGMFGTMVVVLPSFHEGGELIIRHAGREVTADLRTREVSQLNFAAFYADCEHEVRPVSSGNRICLIYNLIQKRTDTCAGKSLKAPDYQSEISAAVQVLNQWKQRTDTAPKIVYLFEHQYTPASLSFAALKNADAAQAGLLFQAAQKAGFSIHLAMVNIVESGAAELQYDSYRRNRWRNRYEEYEGDNIDYEVIDVCETSQYLSNWITPSGEPADFGEIPLGPGELLPAGALDGEKPDSQRVTEATGNEGASFERSYHRAVVVLWPEQRYPEILLQSGARSVVPYFRKRIKEWTELPDTKSNAAHDKLTSLALLIVEEWEKTPYNRFVIRQDDTQSLRLEMLELLCEIKKPDLLSRFIKNVITPQYNGKENQSLAACITRLGSKEFATAFLALFDVNIPIYPQSCIQLLKIFIGKNKPSTSDAFFDAYLKLAEAAFSNLSKIQVKNTMQYDWRREKSAEAIDADLVVNLFNVLKQLSAAKLADNAAVVLINCPDIFAPDTVLVPALSRLERFCGDQNIGAAILSIWRHACGFLLQRSEFPPEKPKDWSQQMKLTCSCAECKELKVFVTAPDQQVHRFRARQDRRNHLESIISSQALDISCQTDRSGSPHSLVCTKNRHSFEKHCEQYAQDIESFKKLLEVAENLPNGTKELALKVQASIQRASKS